MLFMFVLCVVQFCFTKISPVAINLNKNTYFCTHFPQRCKPSPPAISHFASKSLLQLASCLKGLCTDGSLTHFPHSPVSAELLRASFPHFFWVLPCCVSSEGSCWIFSFFLSWRYMPAESLAYLLFSVASKKYLSRLVHHNTHTLSLLHTHQCACFGYTHMHTQEQREIIWRNT